MTPSLDKVLPKIGKLLRLLSSSNDGEVLSAVRMLTRTLQGAGTDMHALTDRLNGDGKISQADMRRLYDAGFADGYTKAQNDAQQEEFRAVKPKAPEWHEMAQFCRESRYYDGLREKERWFIKDMCARSIWREPTERQAQWLSSLYYQMGGTRAPA